VKTGGDDERQGKTGGEEMRREEPIGDENERKQSKEDAGRKMETSENEWVWEKRGKDKKIRKETEIEERRREDTRGNGRKM
jgi:hypothetical protein